MGFASDIDADNRYTGYNASTMGYGGSQRTSSQIGSSVSSNTANRSYGSDPTNTDSGARTGSFGSGLGGSSGYGAGSNQSSGSPGGTQNQGGQANQNSSGSPGGTQNQGGQSGQQTASGFQGAQGLGGGVGFQGGQFGRIGSDPGVGGVPGGIQGRGTTGNHPMSGVSPGSNYGQDPTNTDAGRRTGALDPDIAQALRDMQEPGGFPGYEPGMFGPGPDPLHDRVQAARDAAARMEAMDPYSRVADNFMTGLPTSTMPGITLSDQQRSNLAAKQDRAGIVDVNRGALEDQLQSVNRQALADRLSTKEISDRLAQDPNFDPATQNPNYVGYGFEPRQTTNIAGKQDALQRSNIAAKSDPLSTDPTSNVAAKGDLQQYVNRQAMADQLQQVNRQAMSDMEQPAGGFMPEGWDPAAQAQANFNASLPSTGEVPENAYPGVAGIDLPAPEVNRQVLQDRIDSVPAPQVNRQALRDFGVPDPLSITEYADNLRQPEIEMPPEALPPEPQQPRKQATVPTEKDYTDPKQIPSDEPIPGGPVEQAQQDQVVVSGAAILARGGPDSEHEARIVDEAIRRATRAKQAESEIRRGKKGKDGSMDFGAIAYNPPGTAQSPDSAGRKSRKDRDPIDLGTIRYGPADEMLQLEQATADRRKRGQRRYQPMGFSSITYGAPGSWRAAHGLPANYGRPSVIDPQVKTPSGFQKFLGGAGNLIDSIF
jgi:hypothetical protein